MRDWREERVGELRGVEAKLDVGPIWAERLWNGGATAALSSPAFGGAAAAVCGVWAGKERESEGKRSRRAPWFWCAREKGAAGSVLAGPRRRRGGSREEVLGGVACMHQASGAAWVATGTFQATCGGQRNARGGPGATQSGGRRGDAPATAETEGQAGGGRQGPKRNFQKF